MVELSRSFECVYVELGKSRDLRKQYGISFLDVVMLAPGGRELGRYQPEGIYKRGDPKALAAGMELALAETKRKGPGTIPLPAEGKELIGAQAPKWQPNIWLGGKALKLKDLRGKLVLMRFFTDTCPFCARSMPALEELYRKYKDQGLVVVGFYHPKLKGRTVDTVQKALKEWRVTFPVALDLDWKTLKRYWTAGKQRRATSASFLIDRRGTIRWIHPGPELHLLDEGANPEASTRAYRDLERAVQTLLAEKAGAKPAQKPAKKKSYCDSMTDK